MSVQDTRFEVTPLYQQLPRKNVTVDPRESMRVLPSVFQRILTELTGKPLRGQISWTVTPLYHVTSAIVSLVVGLACSIVAITYGHVWFCFLIPGWMMTLHGMRDLRQKIFHQCSHDNMFANKFVDALLGEIISTLLLVQDFQEYKREHISEHHSVHHMTLRDPTVKALLITFGFRPGMTRKQLWHQLLIVLFSPTFHVRFLIARVTSHFLPASSLRRIVSLGFIVSLIVLVAVTQSWIAFLLVWLLPLTIFFQISNTLRLCVKHTFPKSGVQKHGKAYFASLTYGIFLGECVPDGSLNPLHKIWAWLVWSVRMLLIHFPARYLLVVGDNVCHDYHHRHPKSKNWSNYIFARQLDIDAGHPGWPPYMEVWGFVAAVNVVFDSLSNADPNEFNFTKIESANARELFGAFDD